MKHVIILSVAVAAAACLYAAPTANEDFVIAEDAQTFTNAVNAANAYTDAAISTNNAAFTEAVGDFADTRYLKRAEWNEGIAWGWNAVADDGGNTALGQHAKAKGTGNVAIQNSVVDANSKYSAALFQANVTGATRAIAVGDGATATNNKSYVLSPLTTYKSHGDDTYNIWQGDLTKVYFGNTNLAEHIETLAPAPGNYAVVSNAAMSAIQDHQSLTNYYTKGEAESKIVELAPAPGNYAAVSNAAMNAAQNATNYTDALRNDLDFGDFTPWRSINSDYADEAIGLRLDSGIVRDADDISTQLDAATTTNAQQSTQLTTLAGQVATIGAHLNAEDARFVVTNYNSVTHTPEAYVEIKLPDESWSRIWSEMTRWNYLFNEYLPTNYYDKAAVNAALADKADRAWGFYDSTTGAYAPDGYTWISSEKIAIAANLAYQRTVTAEGAIWVLESNGVVTETGGMTNGFFRISDDEGNSLFEIVKGNKRTVGADASSCQVVAGFTPTKLQIGYSIVSDVHPTLYVCQSLATQDWKSETDGDCIANVTWSGTSGAYVAQVQGKSAYSSLFVKATYEVGGETYISNAAPVSMQYIMIGGVKYAVGVGTVSGTTVLTLTVAQ